LKGTGIVACGVSPYAKKIFSESISVPKDIYSTDMSKNIKYIAVGRTTDHAVLCESSYASAQIGEEYASSVRQVIKASQASVKGTKYSLVMKDSTKLNFYTDEEFRIFIVITESDYPERISQLLLKELKKDFVEKYEAKIVTAGEGAIKAKSMFNQFKNKYEDPAAVDKLSSIRREVDDTTKIMQNTIQTTLGNIEKTENLADDVETLKRNADLFGDNARSLKNDMRCQSWKNTILVSSIVAVLFIVICWVIYSNFNSNQ
jgi:hypothetical protein